MCAFEPQTNAPEKIDNFTTHEPVFGRGNWGPSSTQYEWEKNIVFHHKSMGKKGNGLKLPN
jgi:hypothetical protein